MWNFSLGWFFGGIAIIAVSALIIIFYKQIADHLADGVSSYDKTKLFGIIGLLVGFVIMTNLHTVILTLLLHLIMPTVFNK